MADGTDAVPTEVTGVVEGFQELPGVSITASAPSVSAQTPPVQAAVPAPAQPRSDEQARIRSLQGLWEKSKAERDALTIEKAQLLQELDASKQTAQAQLATSAEATRNAIARAEQFEREVTTLRGELGRLKFVVEHPDLMPYVALVPATDDPAKLNEVAQTIADARSRDVQAVNRGIGGTAVPPASPARPAGSVSTEEMNRQLREAWQSGNYKRFEELKNEFASKVGK